MDEGREPVASEAAKPVESMADAFSMIWLTAENRRAKQVFAVHTPPRHRGPDPEDERSFSAARLAGLRQAASDLCWLLDHGYGIRSSSELVGDRFRLTRRQRDAVVRCSCTERDWARRQAHSVPPDQLYGRELWLDGLNVLTALETALGGGVILIGRDGCCRDIAGVYCRYHKVAETLPALQALGRCTSQWGVTICRWWLDKPVNNSGRLKKILEATATETGWKWEVELVANPDRVLSAADQIVSSSDHAILDRCRWWFNLSRHVIAREAPNARVVDLGADQIPVTATPDRPASPG